MRYLGLYSRDFMPDLAREEYLSRVHAYRAASSRDRARLELATAFSWLSQLFSEASPATHGMFSYS